MDLENALALYKQVEDFLSRGPVPKATMKMVLADIEHSKEEHGIYCGIWNEAEELLGVLDFIPGNGRVATLSLLMIGKPYRKIDEVPRDMGDGTTAYEMSKELEE